MALIFLTLFEILLLIFVIVFICNNVFAETWYSRMFNRIANQTSNLDRTAQIDVGKNPSDIDIDKKTGIVYVANYLSDTVSVISSDTLTKITDIAVGEGPVDICIGNNKVYVVNSISNSVSVIDKRTNKLDDHISVGKLPNAVDIYKKNNTLYVANTGSDSVSVIDERTNKVIQNISVVHSPDIIGVNEYPSSNFPSPNVYVVSSQSGNLSVISTQNNTVLKDMTIGKYKPFISDMEFSRAQDLLYLANHREDVVSLISTENNTLIKNIDIEEPRAIAADIDVVYVTSYENEFGFQPVFVIATKTNEVIENITVRRSPEDVHIDTVNDKIYVANTGSDSVSVIDEKKNKLIKNVLVGKSPNKIATILGLVFVVNSDSNSLTVIDEKKTKVLTGITFEVYPFNSGYIECDGLKAPSSRYFLIYYGTNCIAKPNKGFEFQSWEEKLNDNSTQLIKVSQSSSANISDLITNSFYSFLNFLTIFDFFDIKSEEDSDATFNITKFGTFTANFKELPPPLPPEYVATLFGVVVTAFIGSWLTPTIIEWRKNKKHQDKLNDYQNELKDLYNEDTKLDKRDISNLDKLREKITTGYTRGNITKDQYDILLKNLSIKYNEIFKNEIHLLKNTIDNKGIIKLINELEAKLDDAYLEEKIDKEHYILLKEKISEIENKNNKEENMK